MSDAPQSISTGLSGLREIVARILVPYYYGGFENQERDEPDQDNFRKWKNPPGTPNARAYELTDVILAAMGTFHAAQGQIDRGELTKKAQYVAEGIILRRLHEKRIEGYTIDTAKEIAEAVAPLFSGNAYPPAEPFIKEVERLRAGLQSIVDCVNPLTRAAVREACAEILAGTPSLPSTHSATTDRNLVEATCADCPPLREYTNDATRCQWCPRLGQSLPPAHRGDAAGGAA